MTFAAAFVVGAALLALWLDWRLGGRRPASLTVCVGHAIAACMALRLAAAVGERLAGASPGPQERLIVLFVLLLPGIVYAFLAGLWLMRTLAEASRFARR
jgi:hypothetical protein